MSEQKNWYDDSDSDSGEKRASSGSGNYDNNNGYGGSGGYGSDGGEYYYSRPIDPPGTNRRFGGAAFGCGIASLATLFTGIFSIMLGALGILFANLSRRRGKGLPSKAKTGMVMSIIGLVMGAFITVYSLANVYVLMNNEQYHDEFYQELNTSYKMIYGEDLDEDTFNQMFGIFGD